MGNTILPGPFGKIKIDDNTYEVVSWTKGQDGGRDTIVVKDCPFVAYTSPIPENIAVMKWVGPAIEPPKPKPIRRPANVSRVPGPLAARILKASRRNAK